MATQYPSALAALQARMGVPLSGLDVKNIADQFHDASVADYRANRSQQPLPAGTDAAQQNYFNTVNDAAQDAATGPAGYNRQWVPLLEGLAGADKYDLGSNLPTETYGNPDATHVLQRLADPPSNVGPQPVTMPSVAMPRVTMSRVTQPNAPPVAPTATAPPPSASATTTPRVSTLPTTVQPPLGSLTQNYDGPTSVDALMKRLYGPAQWLT
jgi:hypothetical protein